MKRTIIAAALAFAVLSPAHAAQPTRAEFCIAQGKAAEQVYLLLRNGTAPADLPRSLALPAEVAGYVASMAKPPYGPEALERATVYAFSMGYCFGYTAPRAAGQGV